MLTQEQADDFLRLHKRAEDGLVYTLSPGIKHSIPLASLDGTEKFLLDVNRHSLKRTKVTLQSRSRQVVVLARLDIDGPPHQNPDGQIISCPHLHIYREGFGVKWAFLVDTKTFGNTSDLLETLNDFMKFCNVIDRPDFEAPMF